MVPFIITTKDFGKLMRHGRGHGKNVMAKKKNFYKELF
jgi:hypothetical protein